MRHEAERPGLKLLLCRCRCAACPRRPRRRSIHRRRHGCAPATHREADAVSPFPLACSPSGESFRPSRPPMKFFSRNSGTGVTFGSPGGASPFVEAPARRDRFRRFRRRRRRTQRDVDGRGFAGAQRELALERNRTFARKPQPVGTRPHVRSVAASRQPPSRLRATRLRVVVTVRVGERRPAPYR